MLRSLLNRLLLLARAIALALGQVLLRWGGVERDEAGGGLQESESDGAGDEAPPEAEPDEHEPDSRSMPELVTTAISLLLIALLAAAILYDGYATGASTPAAIEITVDIDATHQAGDAFYIPFDVHNNGDQTIEQALITFEVYDGDNLVEQTETVIPVLGEHGSVSGVLVLATDPALLHIEARASTFQTSEE